MPASFPASVARQGQVIERPPKSDIKGKRPETGALGLTYFATANTGTRPGCHLTEGLTALDMTYDPKP